ncbi:L-rhamnonate dehydratase [Nocardia otitidiscaviarum]|uniref:L-rhamnonate dehydratase n=1 Tax=Nocardia otitidiscaviarum TaxID=1823 RepID=A0A379JNJ3_9NOCA|nr:mandelate racemase/muconate lactonizing enzyme family protein [Nocardia otitidiscaviarum]SUD49593.1 L-rhamnonate dehydratase [Nocardia otitidiscaviarum]
MGDTITAVSIRPLPPTPTQAPDCQVLPDWACPAQRPPAGRVWPESAVRFAVEVVDSTGVAGTFGPVSASVAAVVRDQVAPVVVGCDVDAWRVLASPALAGRHVHGAHVRLAVSAVELAAWDLRSLHHGAAVGALVGGQRRTQVPVYASALGIDIDHPLAADIAAWLTDTGFWASKWALPGADRGEPPSRDAQRLRRLRDAVGDAARLCVDVGGRWPLDYARQMLPALAEVGVSWIEEPGAVPASDLLAYGLARAEGEHDYDPADQLRALSGDVQIWQPDPSWCGGLAHTLAMVELAGLRGIRTIPHGGGLAAALALAEAAPAHLVPAIEYHLTLEPLRQAAQLHPLIPVHGTLTPRTAPGLTSGYRLATTEVTGANA